MTSYAKINYGYGTAHFWGPFTEETVRQEFYRKANDCFGIRKSITGFTLEEFKDDENLPTPWGLFENATTVLEHSGDTIVWDADGNKIKSEWD